MSIESSAPGARRAQLLAALALAALLLAPVLTYRVGTDQGVFAYLGSELLHGRWLYLDTWESDYPGLMFIEAARIAWFGRSIAAFRAFDFLVQLASAGFLFAIARRLAGFAGGLLAVGVFALIYQGYGPWNTGQREGFGLCLALAGLWLTFAAGARAPRATAAGVGLSLGCAFLIKPTLLAFAALYLPLAFAAPRVALGRSLERVAIAAGAAALPTALTLAIYAQLGGLDELWEACVSFQPIYGSVLDRGEPLLALWARRFLSLGRNSLVLAGVGPLLWLTSPRDRMAIAMLSLGYLGLEFAVFVQGTFAGYHYLPGLGLGAILLGVAFARSVCWLRMRVEARSTPRRLPPAWALALALIAVAAPCYVRRAPLERLASRAYLAAPTPGEYSNLPFFDFTESWNAAAYFKEHTTPADAIQIWGYEALTYYLADRRSASRFHITTPLVLRSGGRALHPMQQRWRREFVEDVASEAPPLVAVVRDGGWWWAPGGRGSDALLADFPEFRALLESRYEPDVEIGRFVIYRRLTAAQSSVVKGE